jgi:hypothetical protein
MDGALMAHFALVVFSNPVAGREDEYNEWYSNRHLSDVLRVPGFKSAQRFKLAQNDPAAPWKYLAIYEFEAENPAAAMKALTVRAGTPEMVISDAMDLQAYSVLPWAAITEKMFCKPA